jgi:hypothetical protein
MPDTSKLLWNECVQIVDEGKDTSVMVQEGVQMEFQPVYRSGVWSDTGLRRVMEDTHVRIDDLETYLGSRGGGEASGAFYGVSAVFLAGSTSVLWTLFGENVLGFCGEYVQYMRLNSNNLLSLLFHLSDGQFIVLGTETLICF